MRKSILTIPEIFLIGATRVALGAGLALLLGEKLDRKERRAIGWTLFLTGVATTVPLVFEVLDKEPARQSSEK